MTAAPQDARPKVNQPATSQGIVQLLEGINEVTEEIQEEEEVNNDYPELVRILLNSHNDWHKVIRQRYILLR